VRRLAPLVAGALLACGGEGVTSSGAGGSASGGGGGGGADGCSDRAVLEDGQCLDAGVDQCPDGFLASGDGGCVPELPSEACPPGQMALMGEISCREIMDCGRAPWGQVPVEATTVYVDQGYVGIDPSDGTAERPFTTISPAIAAVGDGDQVAIAAGHYVERLLLGAKRVRIWGRCPSMVRITGNNPAAEGTVQIVSSPDGQELHGVRIDGPGFGVAITDARDVLFDRVWVTQTGAAGISGEDVVGPVSFELVDSLVEEVTSVAVSVGGATARIDRSELRRVAPGPMGVGAGIGLLPRAMPPSAEIVRSLIHEMVGVGIASQSGDLRIVDSAVLDVAPLSSSLDDGLGIAADATGAEPSATVSFELLGTTVSRVHEVGVIVIGQAARIDRVTVANIFPQASDQVGGVGIALQGLAQDGLPTTIDFTSVSDTPGFGLQLGDARAVVDRTILRRAQPLVAEDLFGDGVVVASFVESSELTLLRSVSQDNTRAGLSNFASTASVSGSRFDCNAVHLDGEPTMLADFTFVDVGDNVCGCAGEVVACKVASTNLLPPAAP
jgi:hypothetical protein